MPKKIIVSLVSDQTVPNVLFIKEKGPADFYYFISTEKMEKRGVSQNIINSLKLPEDKKKIISVIEDSVKDIDEKLGSELELEDEDIHLVNITGGTKIMSLSVYNYFSRNGAGDIFYMPIGKNEIRQVFPFRKNRITIVASRLNLQEYLTAYGVNILPVSFERKNQLLKPEEDTQKLFNAFTSANRNALAQVAGEIRNLGYRGKKIEKNNEKSKELYQESEVFSSAGVNWNKPDEISKEETKYITGEWFEEYLYPTIKKTLNKSDDEIGMGLQLIKGETPNEYDIMFTHNNALYVIECKTNVADNSEGKISYLFTNTLYKAATLKKEFGLWVNYFLFALNDFSKLSDTQKNRAKQLDIKLVGLEILSDRTIFEDYIKKM